MDSTQPVGSPATAREQGHEPDDIRRALDAWTLEILPSCMRGVGLILLVIASVRVTIGPLEEPNAALRGLASAVIGGLMLVISLVLPRLRFDPRWAHPLAAAMVGTILALCGVGLWLGASVSVAMGLAVLVLTLGFIVLSWPWFLAILSMSIAFWIVLARWALPEADRLDRDLTLVAAIVATVLIRQGRVRLVRNLAKLRMDDTIHQDKLARALEESRRELARRREAEQALRATDRSKDEFLAILCHELRNPLAAIIHASNLLADPLESENRAWALQMIHRQAWQLNRLVDDLMNVSSIALGRVRLNTEVRPLGELIRSAIETTRTVLDEANHSVELDLPEAPLWIEADPGRMEQILVNLLNNACHYSKPGTSIHVSARDEGKELVVQVRDQGIGIEPEVLPRIFDMFVQGPRSRNRHKPGMGIGLRLVKVLTELHGGTVSARSEGPGRGSEFTLRFPKARPSEHRRVAPDPSVSSATVPGQRLLIVDDNRGMADAMAMLLRNLGHRVWLACSGRDALELARNHSFDLVLLDLELPDIDGMELATRLHRETGLASVPILAMSGAPEGYDPEQFRAAGFSGSLAKPISLERLQDELLRSVAHRGDDPAP